jgi:hypothetical protein
VSGAERDPQAAAEKATKAQLAAQTEIDDLLWLMSDARGRRLVWRLLTRSGIYRTSFSTDALAMAFAEGRRNEGLVLLDEIVRHCPKRFSEMQTEARTYERRKESKKD